MGYIGGVSREALKDTWLGYVLSWLIPTPPASVPLTAEDIAK